MAVDEALLNEGLVKHEVSGGVEGWWWGSRAELGSGKLFVLWIQLFILYFSWQPFGARYKLCDWSSRYAVTP